MITILPDTTLDEEVNFVLDVAGSWGVVVMIIFVLVACKDDETMGNEECVTKDGSKVGENAVADFEAKLESEASNSLVLV